MPGPDRYIKMPGRCTRGELAGTLAAPDARDLCSADTLRALARAQAQPDRPVERAMDTFENPLAVSDIKMPGRRASDTRQVTWRALVCPDLGVTPGIRPYARCHLYKCYISVIYIVQYSASPGYLSRPTK